MNPHNDATISMQIDNSRNLDPVDQGSVSFYAHFSAHPCLTEYKLLSKQPWTQDLRLTRLHKLQYTCTIPYVRLVSLEVISWNIEAETNGRLRSAQPSKQCLDVGVLSTVQ